MVTAFESTLNSPIVLYRVVSRIDDSVSDVVGDPGVAMPLPGTSTIRLRVIKVRIIVTSCSPGQCISLVCSSD